MIETRDPVELVKAHMAAEDKQDIEAALATFTEDCYYEVPGLGIKLQGKEEIGCWYQELFSAVPDFTNTNERYYESDGHVFYEANIAGTHRGVWDGWTATQKRFSSPVFLRIPIASDGLMKAEIVYSDSAGLFMQLGILPKRGSQTEKVLQKVHTVLRYFSNTFGS